MKLFRIISVDINKIDQLQIRYPVFIRYWIKRRIMGQYVIYL